MNDHRNENDCLADALRKVADAINASTECFRSHALLATKQDLDRLEQRLNMNQNELSVELKKLAAQQGKVAKEQADRFDTLTARIKELTDQIGTEGDVSAEVQEDLANLKVALQAMDDTIVDQTTIPPVA